MPWAAANNKAMAKKFYGGSFPLIKGRKYTYPLPHEEDKWMRLVKAAIAYDKKNKDFLSKGLKPPRSADPRHHYILFHARPQEIARRSIRVQHRRMHGLEVGDPRQVHHEDQDTMAFKDTILLTHCQHKREHGQACDEDKKKARKKAQKAEPGKKPRPRGKTPAGKKAAKK